MRILSIFCALILTATSAAANPVAGKFTLKRLSQNEWLANYCFDAPVQGVKFTRPMSGDMRQKYWAPADEKFKLYSETIGRESVAVLQRADGGLFECAAIKLQTYTNLPEKNYLAFSEFSDGGVSVYTGYYTGQAMFQGYWEDTALTASYVPLDGNHVITRDAEQLVHQFVYFGPQQIEEKDGSVAVVDPAVPTGARKAILETLPQVNLEMSYLFQRENNDRYMVFMAGGELNSFDGLSVKAGVQENQINYRLSGRQVVEIAMRDPNWYAQSAAHEVIHLWQNKVWNKLGHDEPWMHEGAADALAYEVMYRMGQYSQEKYNEVWDRAEQDCIYYLQKSSVYRGAETGNFKIVYHCGALINHLVGGVIDADDYSGGLWRFWRTMASWPDEERNTAKSEELFFKTLTKLGVHEVRQGAIINFLAVKPEDPVQAVNMLKYRLGLAKTAYPSR